VRRSVRVPAVVLLVALGGCGTAPAPTPSPEPSVGISLPELAGWQQVAIPAADPNVRYTTVTASSSGFVAAGDYGVRPAAWSSPDGETWTEESIPGDMRTPATAIRWGDRVLVVGSGEIGGECARGPATNTWVRDIGGTWTQAPFQGLFCAGGGPSVAAAGRIAVIVGPGRRRGLSWTSNDGLRWADHAGEFEGGRLPYAVLASGTDFAAAGASPRGAWVSRSPDGAEWTEPVRLPAPDDARPLGATIVGGTIVVMLAIPSGPVGVAWSEDGQSWTAEPVAGLAGDHLVSVEAFDGGLVAHGDDAAREGAAWVSADGRAWRRVALPTARTGGYGTDFAVGHGRVVLLGGIKGADGISRIAAWVGPASLVAP
jgi:hypothetical protein